MRPTRLLAAAFVPLMLLAACESTPDASTFGGALQLQGGPLAPIGSEWSQGEALIAEGEAEREDGEEALQRSRRLERDGERDVRRGERKIEEGRALQSQAERRYCGQTLRVIGSRVNCS